MSSKHDAASLNRRNTQVRKSLLKLLSKNKEPISVQEILADFLKENLVVNKTTVYRQISSLLKDSVVREIRLNDRSVRYELVDKDDHHHHLVCLKCKKIEEISFKEDLERQERIIAQDKKFKVLSHTLEFFGVCSKCQNKKE
jgi:Fe2+ or Zn2+ uptake regulation protein